MIPALDNIFSAFGIPREVTTDNGPPFNGDKLAEFAKYLGFKHRKVTPAHPQANGQAESFMKNLAKVVRNAAVQRCPIQQELNRFLRAYRDTPHSTTGVAPAALMFGRTTSSRLPKLDEVKQSKEELALKAERCDASNKAKAKASADKRRGARRIKFKVGDMVVEKQKRTDKYKTNYAMAPLVVVNVKGSMVTVKSRTTGRERNRNRWHFKKVTWQMDDEQLSDSQNESGGWSSWRRTAMRSPYSAAAAAR